MLGDLGHTLRVSKFQLYERLVQGENKGIRYQVSGILILPGEPLANGYCKWHPEKKGKKKYMNTKQTLEQTSKFY